MTTIAVNKTQIAGDKQAVHSGGMKFKLKSKVFSFYSPLIYPTPFHVGFAGNVDSFPDAIEFFSNPADVKKPPTMRGGEGVILTADGNIFTFFKCANWIKVEQQYYAIGSGAPYAMGAMSQGATPAEAVKQAMKLDPNTGFGVTRINL